MSSDNNNIWNFYNTIFSFTLFDIIQFLYSIHKIFLYRINLFFVNYSINFKSLGIFIHIHFLYFSFLFIYPFPILLFKFFFVLFINKKWYFLHSFSSGLLFFYITFSNHKTFFLMIAFIKWSKQYTRTRLTSFNTQKQEEKDYKVQTAKPTNTTDHQKEPTS